MNATRTPPPSFESDGKRAACNHTHSWVRSLLSLRSSAKTLCMRLAVALMALSIALPDSVMAQAPPPPLAAPPPPESTQTFEPGQLEAMLAPIALYPDALLSQILMASTYPLDVAEAGRWMEQNKGLKGDALQDALQSQKWDESVKSLCAFPEVLERMNKDLAWTQKLGDAFLGQQQQVMDTIQALRKKAEANGNLKTDEHQKVVVENNYITVEPANPQVVYVPTYQPTAVYGAWPYPSNPPYYPSYWAPTGGALASGFFWGAGVAASAALWGGFAWNRGEVNVNVNQYNNFNRANIQSSNWQHNAAHRGGVPYRDNATRQRYGGTYDRQAVQARQQFRGRQGSLGGGGLNDRAALQGAANRGVGQAGGGNLAANRGAGQVGGGNLAANRGVGQAGGGIAGANRGAGQVGAGNRLANRGGGQLTANRGGNIGARGGVGAGRGGSGAFSVANGAQARNFSNRGNASMGNRNFGGGGGAAAARGGGGGRGRR